MSAVNKPFLGVGAVLAGKGIGERTDGDLGEACWRRPGKIDFSFIRRRIVGIFCDSRQPLCFMRRGGVVFIEEIGHELVPDGGGAGNAGGDVIHGRVVKVADPNSY